LLYNEGQTTILVHVHCHSFNFVPIHLIVSIPSFNFQNQDPSVIDFVNFVLQLSKSSKFHYLTFKIKSIISLEVDFISK